MSSSQALGRRNFLRNSGIAAFAILGTGALAACTSAASSIAVVVAGETFARCVMYR